MFCNIYLSALIFVGAILRYETNIFIFSFKAIKEDFPQNVKFLF